MSDLLYVPVRSASDAPIDCRNPRVTGADEAGPVQLASVNGLPASGANAGLGFATVDARICSGCGSENAPLTRWPGAVVLASTTLSAASPAVCVTEAAMLTL